MKIRNGFVSNSSSSSFIMLVKEEDHLKALEKLEHDYYRAVADAIMIKDKCFGIDVRCDHYAWHDSGEHPYYYYEIEFDGEKPHRFEVTNYEIMEDYYKILKEIKADTFSSVEDF